jgi:hypothetical protein
MQSLLTTVPHDFAALTPARLEWWRAHADVVNRREYTKVGYVSTVVRAASRYDAVLLNGSVGAGELYSDLLIAGASRRRAKRIVISDATWKRGQLLDRVGMGAGLRIVDSPRMIYCVLSSAELETFPQAWRIDPSRVVFTPFCYTLTDSELDAQTSDEAYVFAGGDSMRDYGPLLEAAPALGVQVRIASATLAGTDTPPNVCARVVPPGVFSRLLRRASVVVVPLRSGERSAGQQTYLNAMALGKLVVVSDGPGVRDYVRNRVTGLVIAPNDARALVQAVSWALDPRNVVEMDAIRARAREVARMQFSPDVYFRRIARIALDQ